MGKLIACVLLGAALAYAQYTPPAGGGSSAAGWTDNGTTVTATAGRSVAVGTTVLPGDLSGPLAQWTRLGSTARKVVFWGDSTTSNATTLFSQLAIEQTPGGRLVNATIVNSGNNGATLAVALADGVAHGITDVISAAPNLVIMSWLINDVRLGATSEDAATALLYSAIERIHAALPTCALVIRTPLTLLTDDPTVSGYVSPLGSSQAYSTLMHNAYLRAALAHPYVSLLDTMQSISTVTGTTGALNPDMSDILHPSAAGQTKVAASVVALIGYQEPFSATKAANARAVSFVTPWTAYPFACMDTTYYTLVASGLASTGTQLAAGQTFLDFSWPGPAASLILPGLDVIQQASYGCWPLVSGATVANQNSTTTRLLSITTPAILSPSEPINVWRPKYANALAIPYYANTTGYPYRRRVLVVGAGSGYFDFGIQGASDAPYNVFGVVNAANSAITTADTLILATNGVRALSGCTLGANGSNLRCLIAGDQSALANDYGWVFGAHNFEGVPSAAGVPALLSNSTGAGSAALGANSPATTNTAPYTWIKIVTADGSTAYIPAWK